MPLSIEFNKLIFSNPSARIDEVYLFSNLIKALTLNAYAYELHGSKGQVEFDNPAACASSAKQVQCELCDVAIISFDAEEVRLTFLQAKMGKKSYKPLGAKLELPVRQHYLLAKYPTIKPIGRAVKMYPHNALSNKKIESIGSIGVFYKTTTGYDMDYQIASLRKTSKLLIHNYKYCSNLSEKYNFIGTKDNIRDITISPSEVYSELEACTNLNDFETHLRNMVIGDPINISNGNLLSVIIKKVYEERKNNDNNPVINSFIEKFGNDYNGTSDDIYEGETDKFSIKILLIDNTML